MIAAVDAQNLVDALGLGAVYALMAIGIGLVVGRFCQGQVDRPALLRFSRSVHRRPNQRMAKGHAPAYLQQTIRFGGTSGRSREVKALGRAPDQKRITGRLRGRGQKQEPRVLGQRHEPSHKALLDP